MSARRIIPLTAIAPAASPAPLPQRPQLSAPPPLALYIHYPWCVRKCPYCDFNSHTVRAAEPLHAAYVDALIADLTAALPQVWGRRVISVFLGGGTPSLLPAAELDRLLTAVRTLLPLEPGAEVTLEANPGTVEAARLRDYRDAGVTRVSLGVQSFDDRLLAAIGRIHDGREARAAVDVALATFERVNLDLMYALPGQDIKQALADLGTAIASGVGHLSCYHLTLEPNTPFAHQPPPLPDADLAADMQEAIEHTLADAGFHHYEISAFARRGEQCRHNLNYWTFGDYLGIGAGAHGKLSSHWGIERQMRHKHPERYLAAAASGEFIQDKREVSVAELPFEFMMNALRLIDGVPAALFAARTGIPLAAIAAPLAEARGRALLAYEPERLRPTTLGRRFLNDLLQLFLDDRQ